MAEPGNIPQPTATNSRWTTATNWLILSGIVSIIPLLVVQMTALWGKPHLRFYFVAWLVFAAFIATEPRVGFAASHLRRVFSIGFTVAGIAMSLAAAFMISPATSQLAAIMLVTGWILVWFGIVPWTRLIALTGLLWVTWPPAGLDTRLVDMLYRKAATMLSPLLDLIGTPNLLQELRLDLRSERLDLASHAFSWNSVYLLAFCALTLLLWMRRPFVMSFFTLATIPILGWLSNSLKILLLIWGRESFAADWSIGATGVFLNIGLFVLSFLFLVILIDALSFLFEPLPVELSQQATVGLHGFYNRVVMWPGNLTFQGADQEEQDDYFGDDEATTQKKQTTAWKGPNYRDTIRATDPWAASVWRIPLMIGSLLVSVLGVIGALLPSPSAGVVVPAYAEEQLAVIGALDTLPIESRGLKQQGVDRSEHEFGIGNKTHLLAWRYSGTDGLPVVAFDFPYVGQQQHWLVMPGTGWRLNAAPKRLAIAGESGSQPWPIVEVEFVNDLKSVAYGWYTAFDSSGNPAVPESGWRADWNRRLSRTLVGRLLGKSAKDLVTYQTRLFLDSGKAISDSRRGDYQTFVVEASAALKSRILKTSP